VRSVEVKGLRAFLHRSADGTLNLAKLIPEKKEPRKPPPEFRGEVRVDDLELYYQDDGLGAEGQRPFSKRATFQSLPAHFARFPQVRFARQGACPDGTLQEVQAHGTADIETMAVQATLALVGLDLASWTKIAPLPTGFHVERGRVTVTTTLDLAKAADGQTIQYDTHVSSPGFSLLTPPAELSLISTELTLTARGTVSLPARRSPADSPSRLQATCSATLDTQLSEVGAVRVVADVDTRAGAIVGSARLPAIACRHWLQTRNANKAVRLAAGTADLDTNYEVQFGGASPSVLLDGTLRFADGQLQPRGIRRTVSALNTAVKYNVRLDLGPSFAVSGTARARGSFAEYPYYEAQGNFDSRGQSFTGRVRLDDVNVPGAVWLVRSPPAFQADASRVSLDVGIQIDQLAGKPRIGYRGRVALAGVSGRAPSLRRPLPRLDADLRVDGRATLGRAPVVVARVTSAQSVRGLGKLAVEASYTREG